MNRVAPIVLLLALAGGAAFYFLFQPDAREVSPTEVVRRPAPPVPDATTAPPPKPPPKLVDAAVVRAPAADAAPSTDAGTDAEAAGPFPIDLGAHRIALRGDPPRDLLATLFVETTTKATRMEIIRRKRQLVRMLFFLGSHRDADGATGPEGRRRFVDDLLERYRNVVRTGPVTRLEFTRYEVVPRPPPAGDADAGR